MTFSVLRLSEEKSNLPFCLRRNQLILVFKQWLKHLFFQILYVLCVRECACVPIHNSYFVGDQSLPVTHTYATHGRMHARARARALSVSLSSHTQTRSLPLSLSLYLSRTHSLTISLSHSQRLSHSSCLPASRRTTFIHEFCAIRSTLALHKICHMGGLF